MAGDIHGPGREPLEGPGALSQVVDPGPHEVAGEVVVQGDPLPQPLGLEHAVGVVRPHHGGIVAQRVALVEGLEDGAALGPDHLPLGMVVPVLLGKALPTLVPAVHVVVADDVFRVQEREGGGMAVGGDLVVAGGDRPGRVFAVKDVDQPAQHATPFGCSARRSRSPRSRARPKDGSGRGGRSPPRRAPTTPRSTGGSPRAPCRWSIRRTPRP